MPPKAAAATRRPAARRNITAAPDDPSDATPRDPNPPTEELRSTPTPGPSRPPVQRLQSLNKRTPSGSATPAMKPLGLGGEPPKPVLKYKPRAVGRRSKEERDAIEKLEAQRHRERLAEAAAKLRGRGGLGPRGRGGFGRGDRAGGTGGPFGNGPRRGRGGRVGADSRITSLSRSQTRSVIGGTGRNGVDMSSDESDSEVRVNMDNINIESSGDEEFSDTIHTKKGKLPSRPKRETGLRPVRVEGYEHKERVVSVNMESSVSKSTTVNERTDVQMPAQAPADRDDALFVEQGDESLGIENGPRIKEEPADEDHLMRDAILSADETASMDDDLLPEQLVKIHRKLTGEEPQPPAPVAMDPRRLLRTTEEIEEFERHEHDLEEIRKLFTVEGRKLKEPKSEPQPTTEGSEGSAEQDPSSEGEQTESKLAGHLFLMQFPPMTPNLLALGMEQESASATDQGISIAGTSAKLPEPAPIRLEGSGAVAIEAEDQPAAQEIPKIVTATDWHLPAGRVGKMNVHASGRVTIDWGGVSFELDRATGVDFLQEAVIMSEPQAAESVGTEEENKVWSMGQLSGKFMVTPDWEKML